MNRAHSKEQILREKYLDVFKVIILEMEGIEFMLQETISLCCVSLFSHFRYVQLFETLWTVACPRAPLSMGFSRQEYCSGLLCPSPGDLPDPGIEPVSLTSPALAGGFFTTSTTWEVHGSNDYDRMANIIITIISYKPFS